jgi:hypothetical protein
MVVAHMYGSVWRGERTHQSLRERNQQRGQLHCWRVTLKTPREAQHPRGSAGAQGAGASGADGQGQDE